MDKTTRLARVAFVAAMCLCLGGCPSDDEDPSTDVDAGLNDVADTATDAPDTAEDTAADAAEDTAADAVEDTVADAVEDTADTAEDTVEDTTADADADAAADADVEEHGAVSCSVTGLEYGLVTFSITSENAESASALVEYSADGVDYTAATADGGDNPRSEATDTEIAWAWDTAADEAPCGDATIRVTVDDGVAEPVTCSLVGRVCEQIETCRVVSELGTTAVGPTGVVPAYVSGVGGAAPETTIAATNPLAANYWDFDYVGLNEGHFNSTVTLTDETGANVGNPVVLMSAGMDYRGVDAELDGACSAADTFQLVLEVGAGGEVADLAGATADAPVTVVWTTSDAESVSVSETGLLVAEGENTCATIGWELSTDGSIDLTDECQSGEIVACVDSGGVDTASRAEWLPVGDIDANIPGMPSGPPAPAVGETFGITYVVNLGSEGLGANSQGVRFDSSIAVAATEVDTQSVGGSTQPAVGMPFAVNPSEAGLVRWIDVDAFAETRGIFDVATLSLRAEAAGTFTLESSNEEMANGSACNIWIQTACMPYSSISCPTPPPAGGYVTIGGLGEITVSE